MKRFKEYIVKKRKWDTTNIVTEMTVTSEMGEKQRNHPHAIK